MSASRNITWEKNWLNLYHRGYDVAHLHIVSMKPERPPPAYHRDRLSLPLHIIGDRGELRRPVEFVLAWLDEAICNAHGGRRPQPPGGSPPCEGELSVKPYSHVYGATAPGCRS